MSIAASGAFDPLASRTVTPAGAPPTSVEDVPEGVDAPPEAPAANGDAPTPEPETAPAESPPAEKPADDLTRRFQEISDADKKAREALKELKAEKARLEEEKRTIARAKQVEDLIAQGKGPEALALLGLGLDQVAQYHLNQGKPDPLKEVGSVKESLGGELAELRKEIQALRAEKTVTEWRANLTRQIQEQADEYDIVNALGLQDEIEDYAAKYFQDTGELLPPEKAAATIRDRYEELVLKLKGSKRAQKLLGISVEKEPASTARAPKVIREPKPATNMAESPDRLDDGPLDRDERIARIAAKFRR